MNVVYRLAASKCTDYSWWHNSSIASGHSTSAHCNPPAKQITISHALFIRIKTISKLFEHNNFYWNSIENRATRKILFQQENLIANRQNSAICSQIFEWKQNTFHELELIYKHESKFFVIDRLSRRPEARKPIKVERKQKFCNESTVVEIKFSINHLAVSAIELI